MCITRHRVLVKLSVAAIALACGATSFAQEQPTAPTTGRVRPLVGIDPKKTMTFVFEDTPVSAILTAMSERLGFVTINGTLPPTRVTIKMRKEVGPEEAVNVLNEILVPLGYVALRTNTAPNPATGAGSTILRVTPLTRQGAKAQVALFTGADPDEIPQSDDLRTQIIPITTLSAVGLLNELRPLISREADVTANVGSNSIIITDSAAKIRRLVDIIHTLDSTKKPAANYQYQRLRNASAADAAQLINAIFAPQATTAAPATPGSGLAPGASPGARGRAGGGAGGTAISDRLYANADARTNTVILTGPDDLMLSALDMLHRLDAIPPEELNSTIILLKRLNYANAADITPALNQIFGNTSTTTAITTPNATLTRTTTNGTLGNTGTQNRGSTAGGTARTGP